MPALALVALLGFSFVARVAWAASADGGADAVDSMRSEPVEGGDGGQARPSDGEEPAQPSRGLELPAVLVEGDLLPYFADGGVGAAKAELDQGRPGRAAELLQGAPSSPAADYLRSTAQLRAGLNEAAAKGFEGLAERYPALRGRCLFHAALAREALGQPAEALALLRRIEPSQEAALAAEVQLTTSRVLRAQGDVAGAAALLEQLSKRGAPLAGRDVAAEALLALADLAAARKEVAPEREALVRLWAEHPLSPLAALAERRLVGAAAPSVAEQVTRAETLIDAHRNQKGIDLLSPLLPKLVLPEAVACRAHFALGKALRKERQHTKAIASLTPVVAKCRDRDLRARALYVMSSSKSIVEPGPGAIAAYELLAKDFPEHSFADDALFYAAEAYLKANDEARALERLEAISRRYPQGDFAAEALFKSFWIHRSARRYDEALVVVDLLEARFSGATESYEVERARYWRARTLVDRAGQGDKVEAVRRLAAVAQEFPATYYGLMSREWLEDADKERHRKLAPTWSSPPAAEAVFPLQVGTLGSDPSFAAGLELLRLGFPEAASEALSSVSRQRLSQEQVRTLVFVLARAGDVRAAHNIARVELRKDLSGRVTSQSRGLWEVAYPNAFRELIVRHSKAANGLDPDLLQALMREESALDPLALSWAGAVGLTQLMPATAQQVAARLKLKKPTVQALLEPDLNIRLGASYLSSLVDRFSGAKPFAIASYNAGPGAVDRWRKDYGAEPVDAWVENIPIAETRGYVKRVLRSYNTYRLLYGAGGAPATTGK